MLCIAIVCIFVDFLFTYNTIFFPKKLTQQQSLYGIEINVKHLLSHDDKV